MAVTVSHVTAGDSQSADPTISSVSITTGALVLLCVGASNSASPNPTDLLTVSGGGATWTKVEFGEWGSRRSSWMWVGAGFTSGSDIQLTYSGTDPEQFVWTVDQATGVYSVAPWTSMDSTFWESTSYTYLTLNSSGVGTNDAIYSFCHIE